MMRKVFSVALMAFAFGLVQSANAGVTIDLVFQDSTAPTGITIYTSDPDSHNGTGCAFGGYLGGSVSSGYCMDVVMTTDWYYTGLVVNVAFDYDNGLAVSSIYEWKGPIVGWGRTGAPSAWCGAITTNPTAVGGNISAFDCLIPPDAPPPSVAPGTFRIGTIVWDTSGTTSGTEVIAALIDAGGGGIAVAINGNAIFVGAGSDFTLGTHILTIIPEPGTASLLGLGLVGLVLAGRRSRA